MAIIDLIVKLAPWELLNTFLIPFILIFAILWGILTALGVFNRRINGVLAMGMVLFLASTDFFPLISSWMIQLGGFVAVAAFLLLFVGGVIMWGVGRGREIYYETISPSKKEKKILEKIEKIDKKLATSSGDKRGALLQERKVLEDELRIAQAKRKYR